MSLRLFLILAFSGILLGAAASGIYYWQQQKKIEAERSSPVLTDFSLPDIYGQVWHSADWSQAIKILYFWATWNPDCRHEMEALNQLYQQYRSQGILLIGIAIDDPEVVRYYAEQQQISFPILLGEEKAIQLSQKLGNHLSRLPYTVITDKNNRIIWRHSGPVSAWQIEQVIMERL